MNRYIKEKLMAHRGHAIEVVSYGDWDNPADVCVECIDCMEVLISTEVLEEGGIA